MEIILQILGSLAATVAVVYSEETVLLGVGATPDYTAATRHLMCICSLPLALVGHAAYRARIGGYVVVGLVQAVDEDVAVFVTVPRAKSTARSTSPSSSHRSTAVTPLMSCHVRKYGSWGIFR